MFKRQFKSHLVDLISTVVRRCGRVSVHVSFTTAIQSVPDLLTSLAMLQSYCFLTINHFYKLNKKAVIIFKIYKNIKCYKLRDNKLDVQKKNCIYDNFSDKNIRRK